MPLMLKVAILLISGIVILTRVGNASLLKGSDSRSPGSTPPSHRRSVVLFVDLKIFGPFGTGRSSCVLHPVPWG